MPPELRELATHLSAIEQVEVETDKPLGPCTSYRIGGPTAIWTAPRSEEGVRRVLAAAGLFPRAWLTLAALPAAGPSTVMVLRRSRRRGALIPLVMLHHLVYGCLYCAALVMPSS